MNKNKNILTIIISLIIVFLLAWIFWQTKSSDSQKSVVDPNADPFASLVIPEGIDEAAAERYRAELEGTKKMYEEKPDIWETWIAIGNLKNLFKDFEGAIAAYQKSLQITDNNILANRNIAEVYRHGLEDYENAALYYQLAIDHSPADVELYTELALIYDKKLDRPEQALKVYEDALKRFNNHPDVITRLIAFYKSRGEEEKYRNLVKELREAYPLNEVYRSSYKDVPL